MKFFVLFLIASVICENQKPRRYLLYDTNPGEGFNLRRDVYMRVANLVNDLRYKLLYSVANNRLSHTNAEFQIVIFEQIFHTFWHFSLNFMKTKTS